MKRGIESGIRLFSQHKYSHMNDYRPVWIHRLNFHHYTNFTGGGRFRFSAAGKAVRCGLEATVNRGLTAAGDFARRG